MGRTRKRLLGPAAISAVAAASLVGAPAASADEVCIQCPPPSPGQDGTAFHKLVELGLPGHTGEAMLKWQGVNAFLKVGELGFPGNTEDVFHK